MNSYYFYFDKESTIQHLHLIDTNSSTLVEYYRIEGEKRIKHAEFFSEDKFFVLTDNSGIYTGEIGNAELKQISQEQGPATPGYYLDEKTGKFWLATTSKDDRKYILQCWNLFESTLLNEIELPKYIDTSSLVRRSDGCFIFYKHDFDSLSAKDAEHGFYCTNPNTKETKYYKLTSKPVAEFAYLNRNALFANNRDIAVLPAADEFLSSTNEEGESLYEYQVQLIDLNNFNIRWRKSVNKFTLKDICSYYDDEDEKKEELDGLVENSKSSSFNDIAEDWSQFLDSIMLCDDEDAFWLRWSNDAISKVDFDGNLLTPAYKLEYNKKNISKIELINRNAQVNSQRVIMLDNTLVNIGPYYYIDLTQNPYNKDGKVTLGVDKIGRKKLEVSKTYRSMVEKYSVNLIEVSNFNKEGTHEAVCTLAKKMEDIESLKTNNTLIFEFIDSYGRYKSEYDAIGSAVYEEKNIPFIKEYINSFCKYAKSKDLVNGKGDPAFSDTAIWLFEIAPNSFCILNKYFNAIDTKKSKYFKEKILPAIKEHYSHLNEYKAFEKALPKEFTKKKEILNWF